MEHDKQCILVIIGADQWGRKELLAIADGYRESAQSWRELLLDLKRRGLEVAPELAVGDGALGFWKGLAREPRHDARTALLAAQDRQRSEQVAQVLQAKAKGRLQDIWMREQSDRVRSLSDEVFWLRLALDGAKAGKEAMKAKLARLLAEKRTLSRPIAGPQLRSALRRSWRQKQTIKSQSKEIRRLRRAVQTLEAVKAQTARHRAARETLTKALSDRTTELRVALRRSRRQKATIKLLSKEMPGCARPRSRQGPAGRRRKLDCAKP